MIRHCIVDVSNLVHRSKHGVTNYATLDECVGLLLTIVMNSLKASQRLFETNHYVMCFDGGSWRSDYYPDYKGNREKKKKLMNPKEREKEDIVLQVINELEEYLRNYTNVTVLKSNGIEGDDFIARWVQLHDMEGFEHVIVSRDSDFKQLVCDNVVLYDPVAHELFTTEGVFYKDGRKPSKDQATRDMYGETWKVKIDKKTDEPVVFEPEWELFYKCIRGDKGDNITAAYPRVHKTRIREAFDNKGLVKWNNFINETWGPKENSHHVKKLYERNQLLIDLTKQPDDIKKKMDQTIEESIERPRAHMVGAYFAKFCSRYQLNRLATEGTVFSVILSSEY